jgi:hypothetical protein
MEAAWRIEVENALAFIIGDDELNLRRRQCRTPARPALVCLPSVLPRSPPASARRPNLGSSMRAPNRMRTQTVY